MNLKPLNDRLVVEVSKAAAKSAGGILLPENAQEKQTRGKVIAAGPGRLDDRGNRIVMDIKKGDTVIFGKYGGTEVKVGGKEYTLLREEEVLAKVLES